MITSEELTVFKQKMIQKYGGLARPNGREAPVGGAFIEDGMRFTGMGPNDRLERGEPAGIVHEGEMVIEEPMVDKAGGPRAVREEIEGLRRAEKRGVPRYQTGTGERTVEHELALAKKQKQLAKTKELSTPTTVSPETVLGDVSPDILRGSTGEVTSRATTPPSGTEPLTHEQINVIDTASSQIRPPDPAALPARDAPASIVESYYESRKP